MDPEVKEDTPAEEPSPDFDKMSDDLVDALRINDSPLEAATDEPAAAEDGTPAAEPTEAKPTAEPAPVAEPTEWVPGTWRNEAKAKWGTLDPMVKAEVEKRERDVSKFVAEAQPAMGVFKALNEIIQPYDGVFQQYNVQPLEHIKGLLEGHTTLIFGQPEQKVAMFRLLARQAGINLAALVEGSGAAPVDPSLDYVRTLEGKISNLERGVTGVTSTLREAREAELAQSIIAFAADKEAHPHFWELAPTMTQLINSKAAGNLDEAYNIARLQDPVIREKVLEAEVARVSSAKATAERERVAAARKATGANVRSRTGGGVAPASETIDDTLRSTMADIRSRSH